MSNKNYQVIVGLGNPGEKYTKTRHNAGFLLLDEIQKNLKFSDFKFENKFNAEISEGELSSRFSKNTKCELANIQKGGFLKKIFFKNDQKPKTKNQKLILVKPQSFMNKSGEVVQKFINFYKISPENITIVHDDLDLSIGNYKISENSGAGGHNGVQDIINKLGTKEFKRIRIGVEKKEGRESRQISGEKFVLQNLPEDELLKIKNLTKEINIVK